MQPATPVLAAAVLAFLLVAGHVAPQAPVPLIGVVLAVVVVAVLPLNGQGIARVGQIPAELPEAPTSVPLVDLGHLVVPALSSASRKRIADTSCRRRWLGISAISLPSKSLRKAGSSLRRRLARAVAAGAASSRLAGLE